MKTSAFVTRRGRAVRLLASLLLCCLPVLVACNDDDGGGGGASTPTQTATFTPTPTATEGAEATATSTRQPTATRTPTTEPDDTATATPSETPVPPTATPTATETELTEPTATETELAAPTSTATPTLADTATPTVTPTATDVPENFRDLTNALPAAFSTNGSVGQVWIIDAEQNQRLELVGADGFVMMTGMTDDEGSLIFREVPVGASYRVVAGADTGAELHASAAVGVTAVNDPPDQSFYSDQQLDAGYGYLQTRDGTMLAINVLKPAGPGPFPTVIEYSGYSPADPDSPQPSSLISYALGFAVVGVNMRGTGCSGGAFQFFETLQSTDGYDVVETVAAQSWVKGHKVGMVGISYPGISQLFTAQLQPPHLAAIAPLSVIADTGRGTLYPGGILNNGFAVDWAADRQHDAMPGGQGWSRKRLDAGDPICIDNQKLRAQSPDIFQQIEDNPFYRPEIADPLSPITFVHNINVPVFLAGAWQDEQTGPYFATMLDQFTGSPNVHFTMVNGAHAEPLMPTIFSRWLEFLQLYVSEDIPRKPATAPVIYSVVGDQAYGITTLVLDPDRFTDVTTYEEALARYESEPPVRILFESGAGGEPGFPYPAFDATFDTWPIPSVVPTTFYFGADGTLSSDAPDVEGADSFIYDDSRSQVTTCEGCGSGVWRAMPPWNWQPLPDGKAVAYATDPLPETLVMAGSGSADLWLESTMADVDVQVTLSEIRPDGQEVYVQSGWLRASHRKLDEARSTVLRPIQTHVESDAADLPEGEPALLRVEIFPFAHTFRAGSRIRLSVEAPGGDRQLWKFEALPDNGEVTNTIFHSAAMPSKVVLPVVPGIEVDAPYPPCPGLRSQPCRNYVELTNQPG